MIKNAYKAHLRLDKVGGIIIYQGQSLDFEVGK